MRRAILIKMLKNFKILKSQNLEEFLNYFPILSFSFPYLKEKIKEEYLSTRIKGKKGMILKGIDRGKEVGFLVWLEENPKVAYIWWLVVLPEYRGNGIGKLLMEEALKEIENQGYQKVWAKVKNDNFSTLALCLKFQFYIKGITNEDNVLTVILEKNLIS